MKTIQQKISAPFFVLILLIPLITLLLFNVSMFVYSDNAARKELANTSSGLALLVRQQILTSSLDADSGSVVERIQENLASLRTALRLSKLSANTEFVILSASDRMFFPRSYEDSFLSDALLEKAKAELSLTGENGVADFHMGGTRYFATYKTLPSRLGNIRLVFIASGYSSAGIVRFINILLLVIMAIAAVAAMWIARRTAKTISTPIAGLTVLAKRIGSGDFLLIPEDSSTEEVHGLTRSINDMSARLRDYDHAQKAFLQNASHEIRTPLMSIQGYAEGIANGIFADTAKTAQIICEESKRLNALVEELLTLSRIENRTYDEPMQDFNLVDVVKEYIVKVAGYAAKEGKRIELRAENDAVPVCIDDALLARAVINILSNCVKYAKETVTVSVAAKGGFGVLTISDDGAGIAPRDLPHIFERFYKGKNGNFGLGLSIAKSTVEYMKGSIAAYNQGGAAFEIKLPLQAS